MLKDMPEELPEQALDDDALEYVAGGAGSKNGRVESDGTVIAALPNALFQVDIGGQTVTASVSGKLRMNYIRIMPGDRVRVEHMPGVRGRITYRYK